MFKTVIQNRQLNSWRKIFVAFLIIAFTATMIVPPSFAQSVFVSTLPLPGSMVATSEAFVPVLVKGLVIHPDKPLNFDFIIDSGNDSSDQKTLKAQTQRMAKYFLAAITVPENQLWVNLSPTEKNRIIENELGQTDLGRDMLAQDYILKQLTATLMYPEKELGRDFWDKIYKEASKKFGVTDISVDALNKAWIMPDKAEVFEKDNAVYVTQARLKVMLDSDRISSMRIPTIDKKEELTKAVMREIVIPAIEKEVNEGKNFSAIRQIYHAAILAKWYREQIQNTLLASVYVGKNKVAGVTSDEKKLKEEIYDRYISAYKKGVFNYIKEEYNVKQQNVVPKKYFSGGIEDFGMQNVPLTRTIDSTVVNHPVGKVFRIDMAMSSSGDASMMDGESLKLIAITGGTGDIGKSFIKTLDNYGSSIQMLVRTGSLAKTSSLLGNQDKNVRQIIGDMFDRQALRDLVTSTNVVYHFAAILAQDANVSQEMIFAVNAVTTAIFIDVIKDVDPKKKIIYSSSQRIIGIQSRDDVQTFLLDARRKIMAWIEKTRAFPANEVEFQAIELSKTLIAAMPKNVNVYDISKLLGEMFVAELPRHVIARISNAYGPDYPNPRLINRLFDAVAMGRAISVPNETRDFIYQDDLNRILLALGQEENAPEEIDLASGILTSMGRVKEIIVNMVPAAAELINIQGQEIWAPQQDSSYGEKLLGRKFTDIEVGLQNVKAIKDEAMNVAEDAAQSNEIDPARIQFKTQDEIVDTKQKIARARISQKNIADYQFRDSVVLINELGKQGIPLGLGSGNTNSFGILNELGVRPYFKAVIDGKYTKDNGVEPKPSPEIFLLVAKKVGIEPSSLVVIEDTVFGVQAAVRGGFGYVIGLARDPTDHTRLKEAGAHIVYDGKSVDWTVNGIRADFKAVHSGHELAGVIFDLDGVICDLEPIHFSAWKEVFDAFFRQRETIYGELFHEFTLEEYKAFGSGRNSPGVVKSILEERKIDLPLNAADWESRKNSLVDSLVRDFVRKGFDENYVRLFIDKNIKKEKEDGVSNDILKLLANSEWINKQERELKRVEDVVGQLEAEGWSSRGRSRLFIYKIVKDMNLDVVLDLNNTGWVDVVKTELENVTGLVQEMLGEDHHRDERQIWLIIDQHIKRLIQRETIDLVKEKSRDKWLGRLKIAFEYWEQKRKLYTYRLVNWFGSPVTKAKAANVKQVTDEFVDIMQREFRDNGINFFVYAGGSGAGNSTMWVELMSRGASAEQYKKFIMYNSRDRRPDEDPEFLNDLNLNKMEEGLRRVVVAIVDKQIIDEEGRKIDTSTVDVRNIDMFRKNVERWLDTQGIALSVAGQETLKKIFDLRSVGEDGKRKGLDSFVDSYKDQYFVDYQNDSKAVTVDPPFAHKKISSKQYEIALSERLGRLKDGRVRVYGEFDGLQYFWLPKGYMKELEGRGDLRTILFNRTDLQGISFKAIREIINLSDKKDIFVLETIPEFLELINNEPEFQNKIASVIVSVISKVAIIGTSSRAGQRMQRRLNNSDNIAVIGTTGIGDPVIPLNIHNIKDFEAFLTSYLPDAVFFSDGVPLGVIGSEIRNLCNDFNVRIIADAAQESDIPSVLIENGYTILQAPTRGGSSSQTFIALDKDGKKVVIKYSDWDGISGNGIPWLRQQKNKLMYIQRKFPLESRSLYPRVLNYKDEVNYFYYVMEYFEGAEDITQYFFYDENLTVSQMQKDVGSVISRLVDTHYLPQGLPLPTFEGEIESNLFNRAKYRIHLLRLHEGNVYDHLIKGHKFHIGSLTYDDSSWFFEDLLQAKRLTINGQRYYNLPFLLRVFADNIREIQARLGPSHFSHYVHSDIPLRNTLRLPDGSIRFIDVRGVNVHETSPSRVSVEYDLGKIAHSFFMEIVRNKKYAITKAEKAINGFMFEWSYAQERGVNRYLEVWKEFRSLLEQNPELKELFGEEGQRQQWIKYVFLLETFNYLSDAIHRFSQDQTGEDPLMYYLQGAIGLSNFLSQENLLPSMGGIDVHEESPVEVLQGSWLVSPPLSIIRNQLEMIEKGLGSSEILARERIQSILLALQKKEVVLKGEEVDVFDGVGIDAKIIGQIDRNIADRFGYIHETVNAVVVSPDKKKILLTRRAHNKEQYPKALTIPGGHLLAGQSARDGMFSELEEELELPFLSGKLQEVATYSYGVNPTVPNDTTRERRVLYVYQLTETEYQKVLERQRELEVIARSENGEEKLEKALEVRQFEGVGEVWSYHSEDVERVFNTREMLQVKEVLTGELTNVPLAPDLLTHLINSPDLVAKTRAVIQEMPIGAKAGMAFILGTGNNAAVLNEHGDIFTDNGALLEIGFNLLFKADIGQWVFTGKVTRGLQPPKGDEDRNFIDLFSGINIAKDFIDQADNRNEEFLKYVKQLPEGIESFDRLAELLYLPDTTTEEDKRLRALAADAVLKGITEAFRNGDGRARAFVEDVGHKMGAALTPLFKAYIDEAWVENFIMVSGVGENFARIEGQAANSDIFVLAVRDGLMSDLEIAWQAGELSGSAYRKIPRIIEGVRRSNLSWDREVLAARLTEDDLKQFAINDRVDLRDLRSVGISLGGTKIGVAVIDLSGRIGKSAEIKWRERYHESSEDIVDGLLEQIKVALKGTNARNVRKIGISFAGPVNRELGVVGAPFAAPNLPFQNYPLKEKLKEKYLAWLKETTGYDGDIIVDIYNDALAAVLGEALSPTGFLSVTSTDYGGIDIQNIDIKRKNDKSNIKFNDEAVRAVIQNGFEGFTPVIINLTPIDSVLPLLGLKEEEKERKIAKVSS